MTHGQIDRLLPGNHHWVSSDLSASRLRFAHSLVLPAPWMPAISAHRLRRGPYTAAGEILRQVVPAAVRRAPELVSAHEIEILTAAPELRTDVPATLRTLTSLAVPEERTRFYSALRTLRIAHGLFEFLHDYLVLIDSGPLSLLIDDVQAADFTDQEFLAVMLRRMDPALLTLAVCSTPDLEADPVRRAPGSASRNAPDASGLRSAVERYAQAHKVSADAASAVDDRIASLSPTELARMFIWSDCTDDRPETMTAYASQDPALLRKLHDERADELARSSELSLSLGAIHHHRRHGSDPVGVGARATRSAMDHCMLHGLYDATVDFCYYGMGLFDPREQTADWWAFATKLPTSLSAIELQDACTTVCRQARAVIDTPDVHVQLAYAEAMLLTRHNDREHQDHELALGWINQAIAISSLFADPKKRAFNVVFNRNGRALIEAHLGHAERALTLVTTGIETLNKELGADDHLLHRSVLRYNRAQVLLGLGRLEEALSDYRDVIAQDSAYPEYHFDLANLLHRLGRDKEALESYNTAAALGPPFPELFYNRGDLLASMGDLDGALHDFNYVLELDPLYLDAYLNRGAIHADLGNFSLALADVEAGLSIEASNPHLLALQGRLYMEDGDYTEAERCLKASLAVDQAIPGTWALLGALLYDLERLEEAVRHFDGSLRLAQSPTVLFNRASVLMRLQRWAEAERDLSQSIELDPVDPDSWSQRAQCRQRIGDSEGAELDLAKSLELVSDLEREQGLQSSDV